MGPAPYQKKKKLRTRRRRKKLRLIRNQQTGDAGAGEGRDGTRKEGAQGESGHVAASSGRDLRQHADLGAERADVGEAAEGVGGNEARARREIGVFRVGLECVVGDEFVLGG